MTSEHTDVIISPAMLVEELRPLVVGQKNSCIGNSPFVPIHIGTLTAIHQHLTRLARIEETTRKRRLRKVKTDD